MNQPKQSRTAFSPKFEQALVFSNQVHAEQKRKGSGAPYFAHIMGVTALVLEDGGTEEEAIAALLHDSAEDQGGQAMLDTIREKFGAKVAQIVEECSDTLETPKPSWKRRKENHLQVLESAAQETIRIMLADKIYNARNLLRGLTEHGDQVWESFKGGREGTLWYFHQMHALFHRRRTGYMLDEFTRLIHAIETFPVD